MENLEKWGKTQGRGIEDLASEKNWRNGRKFLGRVKARMGAQQGVRDCESRGSGGGGEGDGMGWSRAPEESSSASTRYQALLKVHKHREVKRELWPWLAVN